MKLERYELWRNPDRGSDSFFSASIFATERVATLEPEAQLIWTVEAESWNEAQQKRYDFMGWGYYRTVEEEENA